MKEELDLEAIAARHRAESAARGPADVRNLRPSLREFGRYVTTARAELAVIGEIRGDGDPAARAVEIAEAGAYVVSVATLPERGGSVERLRAAAAVSPVPVLARGMVLEVDDLHRLRAAGADAATVYASLLEPAKITALWKAAISMHMELLVEAGDEASLARALSSEARVIGVSGADLAAAAALLARIPKARTPVLVEGASRPEDLARDLVGRIDAVLLVIEGDASAVIPAFAALV